MDRDLLWRRLLWTAAALAMAAGLAMTVRSVAGLRLVRERYDKRLADLRHVERLAEAADAQTAAGRVWMRTEAAPRAAGDILQEKFPGMTAVTRELDAVAGLPGWQTRRTSIVLVNAPYERLADVARVLAASRPPWTLAECSVAASDRPGQAARIEMTFETTERVAR